MMGPRPPVPQSRPGHRGSRYRNVVTRRIVGDGHAARGWRTPPAGSTRQPDGPL